MDVEEEGRARVCRYAPIVAMLSLCLLCGTTRADPVWVVEPGDPGPNLPPQGRSLFDHLTTSRDGRQVVPFPFEALLALVRSKLSDDRAYLGQPLKQVLIPLGRSLQRQAAAPRFFASPRIVMAVDAEPETTADDPGMLLRDRLYIGYLEAADVLEIISYNETAARFEFQVVTGYRAGGEPRVLYARRLVCTACHQNAAPIFARPLWDETNSNAGVSRELQKIRGAYHGIPSKVGVDIAYAIDNATDRANGLSLTQTLWREGCGDGESGRRCRAALLTRTLQYVFSGGRGFDNSSSRYREQLRDPMQQVREQRWPDGFLLPNPDIPNRKPLHTNTVAAPQQTPGGDANFLRLADVNATFEPLAPRPPLDSWAPDPEDWVGRTVRGLAAFLASADLQRIDAHLARIPVAQSRHTAACKVTLGKGPTSANRVKIRCQGDTASFRAMLYRGPADDSVRGQLRNTRLLDEDLGVISVTGAAAGDGLWHLDLKRPDSPFYLRRTNGDQVSDLKLHWQEADQTRATAELTVRHDGRLLDDAIDGMITNPEGSLALQPFQRARVMPVLYAALGLEPQRWCCAGAPDLPEPETEVVPAPLQSPRLAAFLTACGGCHRSDAPFPPNFLAGTTDQVLQRIAHCGERIQYRLAMWDRPADQRTKSPMPPAQSLSLHEDEGRHWMSGLLPELRRTLREITAAASRPLPAMQVTATRPYFDLRPCLPAS